MNAIYGARFASKFHSDDPRNAKLKLANAKRVWAENLHGLTKQQLRRGINQNAQLSDWDPSIAEFLRVACQLPSLETCIERVKRGANVDRVSYRISSMIGQYAMRELSYAQLTKRVKGLYPDIYESELTKAKGSDEPFLAAGSLPDPTGVEKKPFKFADPEVADSNLSKMKTMLGGSE